MPDVSVSVVPMLDCSESMAAAMPLVIIDGKAFVRAARPGDQIGVVKFQSSASMLFPSTTTLETVDPGLTVTAAAAAKIATLSSSGLTNMAGAVNIASTLLGQATNQTRAYMMLSDGEWNVGGDPSPSLSASYPIYMCGLGQYISRSMVSSMLTKNSASEYLASPNAYEMMKIFNTIRGLAADASVVRNALAPYAGTDYSLVPMTITPSTDECQFTVVFSSERYSYTPSPVPDASHINIQLIDPSGATTSLQPVIAEPGYAIFNLQSPQPGTWQVLSQYTVANPIYSTAAGFEFNTITKLSLDVQSVADPGESVKIRAHLVEGDAPIENAKVWARVGAPRFELGDLLAEHADAIDKRLAGDGDPEDGHEIPARVEALRQLLVERQPGVDPFPRGSSHRSLEQAEDGSYVADLGPTPYSGPHTVEVFASGEEPSSKSPFTRTTQASVAVGVD